MSHSPRTLVAFYSHTKHTRQQGEALAQRLDAEREPIVPRRPFRWPADLWRAGRMAFTGETQPLEPPRHDPDEFDVVVVGTPVWAWHVTPPVLSWLQQHRDRLPAVACFATYGGVGAAKVVDDIAAASGQQPFAKVLISHRDEAKGQDRVKIDAFVAEIERASPFPGITSKG
ncbi:MAG: flavodoxin family protein [Phycisphaeraceae bacterium]